MINRKLILKDLEALLNEKVTCEEFVNKSYFYSRYVCRDNDLNTDFSNLEHYLSDSDIRKKDKEYDALQKNELKKLIRIFKEASFDKDAAESISFLADS